MPTRFANSTGGSNTNDGTTWATANADLLGLVADMVAGDTGIVAPSHSESQTTPVYVLPGTIAAPVKIACSSDLSDDPKVSATTAVVTATSTITVQGSGHLYGLTFRAGNGAAAAQGFILGSSSTNCNQTYDNCQLHIMTTGTGLAVMAVGDDTRTDCSLFRFKNTSVRYGGVNQRVKINANTFHWDGGSILSGSAVPTSIFSTGQRGCADFRVSNVDFTNAGANAALLLQNAGGAAIVARFSKCQMASGWDSTGKLWSAAPTAPGIRVEAMNCMAGAVKIRLWTQDWLGSVRDNTSVYRTLGAEDNGVPFSLRMVSSADAEYPLLPLEAKLGDYVASTSQQTWTYEFIHDAQGSGAGGALRNSDISCKVLAPGVMVDKVKVDLLADPTDWDTSSATWFSGLATPVKQRIAVTFTPTSAGDVFVIFQLFAASKTVYLCSEPVKA